MSVTGRWEGKLVDVTGIAAALTLDLTDKAGNATGDFSAAFLPDEDDCCNRPAPTQAQTGPVTAKVDEKAGRIKIECTMTIGLRPISVTVDGRIVKADPHARRAIVGCFDIREGVETLTLEGGGAVLWQYAGSKRGG
jgi:hypothetical protein